MSKPSWKNGEVPSVSARAKDSTPGRRVSEPGVNTHDSGRRQPNFPGSEGAAEGSVPSGAGAGARAEGALAKGAVSGSARN